MKDSKNGSIAFAIIGVFFSFGCFFNYFFLPLYRALVKPLFSAVALESINATEKMRGTANYVAGFTSQVGYTSFLLLFALVLFSVLERRYSNVRVILCFFLW